MGRYLEENSEVNKQTDADKETKKQHISQIGLYEIEDDYITAYKSVRMNNSSWCDASLIYEIGKDYLTFCDYNNDNKRGPGFSAWTIDGAQNYPSPTLNNRNILKVKIHLDDLGACVHNGHKLRCKKLTVIDKI